MSETTLYAILRREYKTLSEILIKIQQTMNKNEFILSFDKNTQLRILHGIIKSLNDNYNENVKQLLQSGVIGNAVDDVELTLIYQFKTLPTSVCPQKYLKFVLFNPFKTIIDAIINLCNVVGYSSINDVLFLSQTITLVDYSFLTNIFSPTSFKIEITRGITQINTESLIIKKITSINSKHIIISNNQCVVEIATNNGLIKIIGFVENDPLNVHTRVSQTTNPFLFQKKSIIEKNIKYKDALKHINTIFFDNYIENIALIDILTFNEETFIQKMLHDYNLFNELSQQSVVKIIKNFTKDINNGLEHMFLTIKMLLLGNVEQNNIAKLLFDMLKDKKQNDDGDIIANLIYNQLNFALQMKLNKIDGSFETIMNKIKNSSFNWEIDQRKQIALTKNIPEHVKKICYDKLDELKNATTDSYKIKNYVNVLTQFPWLNKNDTTIDKFKMLNGTTEAKTFLENLTKKLDAKIYGHNVAKTKIRQIIGKIITGRTNVNVQSICLCGPMGVGKSMFANCIAESMGIPFVQILLGGENTSEVLCGYSYTYAGAQPGLIVKKMVEAGESRCLMYFDELDKCVAKGNSNEVMNVLIHLLDPITNKTFQDRFFQETTFPLNEVIFVVSCNDKNKIDKILLDRLEIIEVGSYSVADKLEIVKTHFMHTLSNDFGFNENFVQISDSSIKFIINNYTKEAGVRKLKEKLENIFLSLNENKIMQVGEFANNPSNVTITDELIEQTLGKVKMEKITIHSSPEIGVINGLYASTDGGGIVPVQMAKKHLPSQKDDFITITGNVEKVMHESVHYAFNMACNLITENCMDEFMENYKSGIHVHILDPATKKDGPSAGCCICVAFLSLMLECKIKNDYALTGEIDLFGNVGKIGGLNDKISGGFASNVKTILIPLSNKNDVDEIKKNNLEIFTGEIQFIENIMDVAEKILIGFDDKKHKIKYTEKCN